MKKVKLLIIAPAFYPQKNGGGPIVSAMNLVKALKDKFEIYIISNNFEFNGKEPLENVIDGWNTFDFGKVYYFPYAENTIKNNIKVIREVRPDTIYKNGFFSHDGLLAALLYKRFFSNNVKLIIAPRGEFGLNAINMKSLKKKFYTFLILKSNLINGVYFHATGRDEKNDIIKILEIKDFKIFDIQNISLIKGNKDNFIDKKVDKLKIVYIARIHKIKNLLFAIKILSKQTSQIEYDIYGPIEQQDYYNLCKKEIEYLPINIQVRFCGQLDQDAVSETINKYHLFFMPTLSENFGHSIVEALYSNRPVLISNQTPWNDLEKYNAGYAIALDNTHKFDEAISIYAKMDNDQFSQICNNASEFIHSKLNIKKLIDEYVDMFSIID